MATYYVNGGIYDKAGNPLRGVSISLVEHATSKQISNPVTLSSEFYEAWTDTNDTQVSVLFRKDGYKDLKLQMSVLRGNPDVTMEQGETFPVGAVLMVAAAAAVVLGTKKKRAKVGKLEKKDVLVIFLLIGGVIGFNIIRKILDKLGLGSDPAQGPQSDPNSAWKPGYWQEFTTFTYAITESAAKQMAQTIYNAFTVFQDDYNAILSVFNQMRTKANVSFLSWVFSREYNMDLLAFLGDGGGILPWDGISKENMQTLIRLVDRLPKN